MKRILVSIFIAMAVSLPYSASAQGSTSENPVEKISAFRIEPDSMVFTVWNSGYTDRASFVLEVKKTGSMYQITLLRIKNDFGKMMPQPMEITFTQEQLKDTIDLGNAIQILNSFSPDKF